jgi:hypothetical protein
MKASIEEPATDASPDESQECWAELAKLLHRSPPHQATTFKNVLSSITLEQLMYY